MAETSGAAPSGPGSGTPRSDLPGSPAGWGTRLRRTRARPSRRYVYASVGLHLGILALLLLSGIRLRQPVQFEQYRVTLVSPPAQVAAPVPEPVQTTTPVVVEPEPPKVEPTPAPPQPTRTQAPTPKPPEKKPDPQPARGPDPKPTPVGGENIQIALDGREFQYPDYLENIVTQLYRYFRWNGPTNLEAELVFFINRDGSVGGIRIVQKSGNFNFDMQAAEAVEQVGRARAFGALPEGWQRDRLYIQYKFEPPNR